ncbi:MAG: PASTA domain-containing protein [Dethiobacter sp.]|nr:PASTA domain-containing protein [Dethiobacter sp.]
MAELPVTQVAVRKKILITLFLFALAFLALTGRLAWIQIVQADQLYEQAWEQWNRSIPTRSPRGSIYDRHGRLLAGSTTVETVVAIPLRIEDSVRTAQLLSPILEMEEEKLLELLTMDLSAIYLKRRVGSEVAQAVRDLKLPGIVFTTEGQRYYPGYTLASQLLGFVGMDQGWGGLEIYYEEYLKGREGRMFFPSDRKGRQIPHDIKRYVPPKEGLDLSLTIDESIQFIVERELARAMLEYQPKQAMIIAADPRTGAILAAAAKPDFDPLNYSEFDPNYWALAPVTDSFEPGSTFKLVTMAAAIEERQFNRNEIFFCSGYANVAGYKIGCWTAGRGHGAINFLQAIQSSCNPAFITLGQRLGKDKLFAYINAFGFGQATGIDYPGEAGGLVFNLSQVGALELATTSFGQGVSVTPLQQIMAVSAMVNGGFLMRPYMVREMRDSEENIVYKREPEVVRQVISRETSRQVAEIMESVIAQGSGRNAAIEGFRIGGKTGTAQKVGPGGAYLPGQFIVSFIGVVPVDDPQFVLYIAVDSATRGAQWGSQIGAPIARRVLMDVVNYLQIPSASAPLQPVEQVEVPDLQGLTVNEAAEQVEVGGLLLRIVGEGQYIVKQTPKAGAKVAQQTQVVVYLSDEQGRVNGAISLPDLRGFTIRETGEILSWLGLNFKAEGSGVAVRQLPESGAEVESGAEIKVYFDSPLEP